MTGLKKINWFEKKLFGLKKSEPREKLNHKKVVRVDWLGNLASYKEDYIVSLFYVVCTVTVRIFCSRCDASLVFCFFHFKEQNFEGKSCNANQSYWKVRKSGMYCSTYIVQENRSFNNFFLLSAWNRTIL